MVKEKLAKYPKEGKSVVLVCLWGGMGVSVETYIVLLLVPTHIVLLLRILIFLLRLLLSYAWKHRFAKRFQHIEYYSRTHVILLLFLLLSYTW